MKGREQRQVVVMHSAGVDAKRRPRRTAAKKHHPSPPPHARECVAPARHVPGTLNHQVGTMTAVQRRDRRRRFGRVHIDHTIRAEQAGPFQRAVPRPATATSRTRLP